jgi:hypothetical protein
MGMLDNQYWDNGTDVFSSASFTRVPYTNAAYVAWLAAGNTALPDPGVAALRTLLNVAGLGRRGLPAINAAIFALSASQQANVLIDLFSAQVGTTISGQKTITGLTSTATLSPTQAVIGLGFAGIAHIVTVDSATQVTTDTNAGAGAGLNLYSFAAPGAAKWQGAATPNSPAMDAVFFAQPGQLQVLSKTQCLEMTGLWILDNPNYLVNPTFDPTISLSGMVF